MEGFLQVPPTFFSSEIEIKKHHNYYSTILFEVKIYFAQILYSQDSFFFVKTFSIIMRRQALVILLTSLFYESFRCSALSYIGVSTPDLSLHFLRSGNSLLVLLCWEPTNFLKDLCINKQRLTGNKCGKNVLEKKSH